MHSEVDDLLVQELRRMVLDGATPSRLILEILDKTSGRDGPVSPLIDRYFSAAFGSKIYRIGTIESPPLKDLNLAYLNGDVLHTILQDVAEWKGESEWPASWCDNVVAVDISTKLDQYNGAADPVFAAIWNQLDEDAKSRVRHQMAVCKVANEQVRLLKQLVERLQQKLHSLEQANQERPSD